MLRHARGLCGIAGVLAAGVAVTAAAAATVPAPAAAFAWDLDRQYPDAASWLSAQSELRARLSAFTRLQNDPIASARDAADRLDEFCFGQAVLLGKPEVADQLFGAAGH